MPERLHVLGLLDTGLLWFNLSVSLLVIVAGSLLVPALSLPYALGAIGVASLVGNVLLGIAGAIGADARVPAMVLLRAPLGRFGSFLPTALNVVQCVGWAVFELIVIATASSALSERAFGFGARWLWTLLFGALTIVLAFLGPVGFVRRYVRKFAVWAVLASLVYLTWWSLHHSHLAQLWHRPAKGGLTFWQGVDLMLASIISWTPLVADYTRFSRDRATAFLGVGVGYLLPCLWLFPLGAVLLLSRGLSDPAALPAAIAAGGIVSFVALLAITVDESDEAFANTYSGAVSLQNVFPRVPQRVLIVVVACIATGIALALDLRNYATFLFLLGSFFVPLFGVLLADWLGSGAHYRTRDVFDAPPIRAALVAAWIVGFALYQWLDPQGPAAWTRLVERTHPQTLPFGGASLPSFAAAFLLAFAARQLSSRGAAARARRESLARQG